MSSAGFHKTIMMMKTMFMYKDSQLKSTFFVKIVYQNRRFNFYRNCKGLFCSIRTKLEYRVNQSERLYWGGQPIRAQTLSITDTFFSLFIFSLLTFLGTRRFSKQFLPLFLFLEPGTDFQEKMYFFLSLGKYVVLIVIVNMSGFLL